MIRYLKNIWKELGHTIFTGERYKANLRGLAFGSVLIVVLSIVTGYMNLNKGYLREASTAILGVISGLFALFFTVVKKDRRLTIITATLYFMINYTYDTFFSTNGFAILWTLLLPLALAYFGSVKSGVSLKGGSGSGQSRKEQFPCQHVTRDTYSYECDHRNGRDDPS